MYRVTEILNKYSNFDRVPPETLQLAAVRGTAVHDYLAGYVRGIWLPRPEGAEGYCESGDRWIDLHVKRWISVEEEYRDEDLGFYGHPDLVAETDLGIMVVDYKTPAVEAKTWGMQLSAYRHLAIKGNGYHRCRGAALKLHPEGGNAKLVSYDERHDYHFSLFMGALNLHRFFND